MKYSFYSILKKRPAFVFVLVMSIVWSDGKGQIIPFNNSYFNNQYLLNPAMSVVNQDNFKFDLGYRKEGVSFPDGPDNQYLTGAYGISDKMGVGINLYHDKAGILSTTRAMATYFYRVQLSSDNSSQLLFGLSVGMEDARINTSKVIGNIDDPVLAHFNNKGAQFDSDFGVAYTNKGLTAQVALPGMVTRSYKDKENINYSDLFSSVSYKFILKDSGSAISVEPKISYRDLRGMDDVFDFGANATFIDELLNMFVIYHTNNSFSGGAGITWDEKYHFNVAYNSQSSAFRQFVGGTVELGIGIRFGK